MPEFPQFQLLVNALGWMLVHFLWQGFVIAGAFWSVCKFSRADSAQLRYGAGLAAYLLAGLVPLTTFLVYLVPAGQAPAETAVALPAITVIAGAVPSFSQVMHAGMEPALPLVVVLWAIGVAILSSRTLLGWLGTRRLVRLDAEPVSRELLRLAGRLIEDLGIRQAVSVVRSKRVAVPTVIGWLKPVILMPAGVLARLPVDQLEMIIAHELGHIRRHDYLVNLLQLLIETLFFYHPAVRWMSRQVRQEREHCCDDLVVAQCGRPVLYARALANLEILRHPAPATAMTATGGDLFVRVRRIVRGELPRNSSGFAQLTLVLGVAAMVSVSAHRGLEFGRELSDHFAAVPAHELRLPDQRNPTIGPARAEGYRRFSEALAELARPAPPVAEVSSAGTGRSKLVTVAGAKHEERPAEPGRQAVQWSAPKPIIRVETGKEPGPFEAPEDQSDYLLARAEPPRQSIQDPHGEPKENRSLLVLPSPTVTVAPKYPYGARSKHQEGFVKLGFSVDPEGRVTGIEIVDAQPAGVFDRAAKKALGKWKFEVRAGHDADRRLFQTFDFAMDSEPEPEPLVRERRCDSTGSKICGMFYNRDHVQRYGSQKQREALSGEG